MRILFDMCMYDMRNKGNIAMLQVALKRFQDFWPEADLEVISISPHILRLYSSTASAVGLDGQDLNSNRIRSRVWQKLPLPLLRFIFEAREALWYHWPDLLSGLRVSRSSQKIKTKNEEVDGSRSAKSYQPLLNDVNLYIATGSQYMSDACKDDAIQLLDRLEQAHQMGIPVFMVGQGIGPFQNPDLKLRASQVLPQVDLILVREKLAAPALLQSVGVSSERIVFTGDDAIELAYTERKNSYGNSIGVSIRVADYTEVETRQLNSIQNVLRQLHQAYQAPLMAIPISHSSHELDDKFLSQVFAGMRGSDFHRFERPVDMVRRIAQCRFVVTGTYHGAVFALAQGIPAIGLVRSKMYVDKFNGLAEQFGEACQIVHLDDEQFHEKVIETAETFWKSAPDLRSPLLASSESQIKSGQAAYRRIYDVYQSRSV